MYSIYVMHGVEPGHTDKKMEQEATGRSTFNNQFDNEYGYISNVVC